jgi:DNA-binding transcriptional ArsR family regulator
VTAPAEQVDDMLSALADPVRRRAVELLAVRPHRAGELAEALGIPTPAMSKHLRVLRERGVVTETSPDFDARVRIYSLRSGAMTGLRSWLAATEQGWTEQLAAFAEHVGTER